MIDLRPTDDDIDRLADALRAADYDADGVAGLLGPTAHAALGRGDRMPALLGTGGGTALETLVRMFLLGSAEPVGAVTAAFGPLPIAAAVAGGLVTVESARVRAAIDLRPYEQWWVVSDLDRSERTGPLAADHVLGVGGASVTLARAAVPVEGRLAVDIGTGSGVQALHLAERCEQVIATDVSARALDFARVTARLAGQEWDLRRGDLLDPIVGEQPDVVVSNPPFVVGPGPAGRGSPAGAAVPRMTYRDSGLVGDAATERLVRGLPSVLAPGGHAQLLGNWLHVRGASWQDRVGGWLAGVGCDAWVVQREVQDPAEYVALWLADSGEDAGPAYDRTYEEWLRWFETNDIEAVGFGLVNLHRSGRSDPAHRIEEIGHPVDAAWGPPVLDWFDRQAALAGTDLLATRLRRAPGLTLERSCRAGESGWETSVQRLRQGDALRRSAPVDDLVAALVAGCDGSHRAGELIAILAAALEQPLADLEPTARGLLGELVTDGYLIPEQA